ncbi:MAG: M23 family metallopeptidase [Candidatus Accumulibacter phosphatis]|uniref:M23 family metallopeptidase n=1 Tax=Candidatus Accumulibacter phosphatis TaxID=327160 RepID=UPI001A57FCC5|nr:M23 family metallopeptidase [Candidatus Accumulibacter phosphatis]
MIQRGDSGFLAHEEAVEFELRTVVAAGEIHGFLFAATDDAGIPDAIANQLIETLGSEIDFRRDLRKGERFALIYETLTHRGQTIRSGRLVAAEIRNNHRLLQAYWFQPEHAEGAYYTADDGRSRRQAFLLSLIEFSRVTSGFADARLHPILQTWQAHRRVDYAAPTGTRALAVAVADGIVEAADFRNGYGKLIVLMHQGAYSTAYGHLDVFAPGIRAGARIRQGDTIGTVGQTGLATGPDLHYEFRGNDEPVDPSVTTLPKSSPLDGAQLARRTNPSLARRAQLDVVRSQGRHPGRDGMTRSTENTARDRRSTSGRRPAQRGENPAPGFTHVPCCRSASRT